MRPLFWHTSSKTLWSYLTWSLLEFTPLLAAWVFSFEEWEKVCSYSTDPLEISLYFLPYWNSGLCSECRLLLQKIVGKVEFASFCIHFISCTETCIRSHKSNSPKSNDLARFNFFAYFFSAQFLAISPPFCMLKIHLGAAWRPSESTKKRAAWVSCAPLSNA